MLRKTTFILLIFATFLLNPISSSFASGVQKYNTTNSFIDPSCTAIQGNTSGISTLANKRLSNPNFLEIRIEIQKNITKFLATRIKGINIATGQECTNVIAEQGCTVTNYINPDGTPITSKQLYDYIVIGMLYKYIAQDILDTGQLETLRYEFAKGYLSDPTFASKASITFEQNITTAINNTSLINNNNAFNNKSSQDIINVIDSSSTKISEAIAGDALFFQKAGYSSLVDFPITSRLIECLDGTFRNLFMRDLPTSHQTPFRIAQDYFKPIVILALILYFIIYGYKILIAHGLGKRSDMFMFAIKFGIVFYFSIGDAWKDFGFDFIKSIPATIAKIVFEALPSNADRCTLFSPSMYPQGKGMLAFFDTIDCKFANYIGIVPSQPFPLIFIPLTIPMLIPIPIVGMIVTVLTGAYIAIVVYSILSGMEIYLSSIIFTTFYLFLAPLVIPMALFTQTEDIAKMYQQKIVSCIVQGVMATIFIITTMALMDGAIYGSDPQDSKHNLFKPPSQSFINGIPRPNSLNDECYGGSNNIGGFTTGDGASVVPLACHLVKLSSFRVFWVGWPDPIAVSFFMLPAPDPRSFVLAFTFIIPLIVTIMQLLVITTIIGQTKSVIDKISGADSSSPFGADKKAMEAAKNAAKAIKDMATGEGGEAKSLMKAGKAAYDSLNSKKDNKGGESKPADNLK
jgi:type IV secretory pathway VirB6-like protein